MKIIQASFNSYVFLCIFFVFCFVYCFPLLGIFLWINIQFDSE